MTLIESDRAAAIGIIAAIAAKHPGDGALANLLERTRNLGEGHAFVLG
jgi:adenylate cyclase